MIARWVVHVEAHRGYRPRISIRRIPRPGTRLVDGGIPGTLVACRACDGQGLLHSPDGACTSCGKPLGSKPGCVAVPVVRSVHLMPGGVHAPQGAPEYPLGEG